MDMRDDKWFSQLKISGIGKPIDAKGSLITILGSVATQLKTAKAQKLSDGSVEIQLTIRELPFEGSYNHADSFLNRSIAVNLELDTSDMLRAPNESESFEDYIDYLLSNNLGIFGADAIAREHYGLAPDPEFLNWMNDPKAIRFRTLNSVQSDFDKALPSEYSELKHYVIHTYPQFLDSITFRTA